MSNYDPWRPSRGIPTAPTHERCRGPVSRMDSPVKGAWKGADRWEVGSNTLEDFYVVSRLGEKWGCSCAAWRFRREECKHIMRVQNYESEAAR